MATVFITGATDGIGLAMAKQYAERGAQLILLGRRPLSDLDAPFFTATNYIQADLSRRDATQIVCDFLDEQHIHSLDVLIHNAGMGHYGTLADHSVQTITDIVNVNLRTPIAMTHALLPRLKGGKLVFVSSVVTALPTPDYALYTATKAALDGFGYNLRIELQNQVDVKVVHPGATRTGMHHKIGIPADRINIEKFPPPEQTAAGIIRVIDGNKGQAAIGLTNKLLRFVGTHFAGWVDSGMKRSAKKQ